MHDRIHDDEPDTGEAIVRHLLARDCPDLIGSPAEYVSTSGTDNAMWRIRRPGHDCDLVVRLPRRSGAAAGMQQEIAVLHALERLTIGPGIRTPKVVHAGSPTDRFPHPWCILAWVDGTDAWSARAQLESAPELFQDLASTVSSLAAIDSTGVARRTHGDRGGPLTPVLDRLDVWLANPAAAALVDVTAVSRLADEARELIDEHVQFGFVHGDLIPGNVLVEDRRLRAVIDWGGAGWGDLAQDLAPAWSVLDSRDRLAFRDRLGTSDAVWIRGRAFELEHAVGSYLYYKPRRHELAAVMKRTLDRILAEGPLS